VAKVVLMFGCAKQSKNLKRYLLSKYLLSIYLCISDVESQEDARLCNFWEDVCYGKLTIAEVNVTLSQGSIMDLIEIKIQKGKEHLLP
jgi:hypothetical protein